MPFSDSFSDSFNKQASPPPEGSIGALTNEFYEVFGVEPVALLAEEFNEVMGDWSLGDLPP